MVDQFVVMVQLENELVVHAEGPEEKDRKSCGKEDKNYDEGELESLDRAVDLVPVVRVVIFGVYCRKVQQEYEHNEIGPAEEGQHNRIFLTNLVVHSIQFSHSHGLVSLAESTGIEAFDV